MWKAANTKSPTPVNAIKNFLPSDELNRPETKFIRDLETINHTPRFLPRTFFGDVRQQSTRATVFRPARVDKRRGSLLHSPHSKFMLDILQQLLVVQDRDRHLAQLKAEAERIPVELAAANKRLADESAKLEHAKLELRRIETERKKLEVDADAKRQQILKYRTQLNLIKSNTEYQALLKEINKAEDDIRLVEDVELDFMDRLDKLQPALKREQAQHQELTAKSETEKAELQKRAKLIGAELAQLQGERAKLVATMDADALSRYDRLLRSKGDFAVVPIKHGNCGGCHLNLPPQLVHNAQNEIELTSCSYCGRILYWRAE